VIGEGALEHAQTANFSSSRFFLEDEKHKVYQYIYNTNAQDKGIDVCAENTHILTYALSLCTNPLSLALSCEPYCSPFEPGFAQTCLPLSRGQCREDRGGARGEAREGKVRECLFH